MSTLGKTWSLQWSQPNRIKQRLLKQRREIDPVTGCWNWQQTQWPYPRIQIGRRSVGIHQAALWAWKGIRANGHKLMPLHSCDNAWCFNPDHLRPGTAAENIEDKLYRGHQPRKGDRKVCGKGHALTDANTYFFKGNKRCRYCHALAERNYRQLRKVKHRGLIQ